MRLPATVLGHSSSFATFFFKNLSYDYHNMTNSALVELLGEVFLTAALCYCAFLCLEPADTS